MEITEAAKARILKILESKGSDAYLRVFVVGGGCNGFKYGFDIDDRQPDDTLFDRVIVDPMSYVYLEEAELDFKVELMGESFVINNPNTQTTCGCGASVGF